MRLLLDTHILLWWLAEDAALPRGISGAIADPRTEIFVSAATTWEIAIKLALGRLAIPAARLPAILAEARMSPLAISVEHTLQAASLPPHHNDPFDRMLIAQARHEGLTVASVDRMFARYAVAILDGSGG